ncbi:hypothetical protein BH11CYA1_BH11CYA1_20010 [soil metagenome]
MPDQKEEQQETKEDLVPHFMPALGTLLALLEMKKKERLSEQEIIECRDNAACIMMQRQHVEEMKATMGVDVDPENVLADWQKRRIEYIESYWPSLVLCVLTKDEVTQKCCDLLKANEIEFELKERDEQLPAAITQYASYFNPYIGAEEKASLATHSNYLIVHSQPFKSADAIATTSAFLPIISELFDKGALAVSVESASVMHSKAAWQHFNEKHAEIPLETMICAYVQMPVTVDGAIMSVGMQHLGQPDYIVDNETLRSIKGRDPSIELSRIAFELFQTLAIYQLEECQPNSFLSGNTFSLNSESQRFKVCIEHCSFFRETDIRFNPFGMWRLSLK